MVVLLAVIVMNKAARLNSALGSTSDHCSIDVVQGGFITVMLDAAMSHAIFAHLMREGVVALSSYEVTTRY